MSWMYCVTRAATSAELCARSFLLINARTVTPFFLLLSQVKYAMPFRCKTDVDLLAFVYVWVSSLVSMLVLEDTVEEMFSANVDNALILASRSVVAEPDALKYSREFETVPQSSWARQLIERTVRRRRPNNLFIGRAI